MLGAVVVLLCVLSATSLSVLVTSVRHKHKLFLGGAGAEITVEQITARACQRFAVRVDEHALHLVDGTTRLKQTHLSTGVSILRLILKPAWESFDDSAAQHVKQWSCFDCGERATRLVQQCDLVPASEEAQALPPAWSQRRGCRDTSFGQGKTLDWVHNGSLWRLPASRYTQKPGVPPPRHMPDELRSEYTLGGLVRDSYAWTGADKSHTTGEDLEWPEDTVDEMVRQVTARTLNVSYGAEESRVVIEAFRRHRGSLEGSRGLVVGSIKPWLEAIGLEAGAASVHTVEYASIRTSHPRLATSRPSGMEALMGEQFDWAASYSSIEHDGLGRCPSLIPDP